MNMRELCVYIDGGCWPNPGGRMSICVSMFNEIGAVDSKYTCIESVDEMIFRESSNNVAEYFALYCAVCDISTILKHISIGRVSIYSDSALLVNQMKELWKVRSGNYVEAFRLARGAIFDEKLENIIEYVQVSREKNIAGILLEKWQKSGCERFIVVDNEFSFLRDV